MKALNDEMSRAQRSGTPCSMAIIDLDLFKRINDRYGHPVGDEVLKTFAIAVEANVRTVDKLGRYGGEEFLLVLPGSAEDQALIAIYRLRQIIADLPWNGVCDGLNVTISAGVSEARENEGPDDILARADAALYRAKGAGRNRVLGAWCPKGHRGGCDDAETRAARTIRDAPGPRPRPWGLGGSRGRQAWNLFALTKNVPTEGPIDHPISNLARNDQVQRQRMFTNVSRLGTGNLTCNTGPPSSLTSIAIGPEGPLGCSPIASRAMWASA